MNFLQYDLDLKKDDVVEVSLDKQANVRLMDGPNFQKYRRGERHRYYGGLAKSSPVQLKAPSSGRWHLVVDLGGYAGRVNASVSVMNAANVG